MNTTTIELKNCPGWTATKITEEEVQNTYGYPYRQTYNFSRNGELMFHFRSMEELRMLQLERIINLHIEGEVAGRRAETKAFQDQVHKLIDASGLRPLLIAVLRDLMGGPRF